MSQARCPHCRTTASATFARGGGYRCKLCGGPRVVSSDTELVLSGNELAPLTEARRAARARWLWFAASAATGTLGVGALVFATVLILLFEPAAFATALLLGAAVIPLLFCLWTFTRSRGARAASQRALHEARLGALRDALASGRELRAADVTRLLALPPEQSELLLAELNVDDSVLSTITDGGDVAYRTANLRLRIEDAARAAGLDEVESPASEASVEAPDGAEEPGSVESDAASRRRAPGSAT